MCQRFKLNKTLKLQPYLSVPKSLIWLCNFDFFPAYTEHNPYLATKKRFNFDW